MTKLKIFLVFLTALVFLSGCAAQRKQQLILQESYLKSIPLGRNPVLETARGNILSGDIPDAIIEYKELVRSSKKLDPELLSEYAYALALGGFYDFALANLDRARLIAPDNKIRDFYASQVFLLMRYPASSFPGELWTTDMNKDIPGWISNDVRKIRIKYKTKMPKTKINDLGESFSKANLLLAQHCFFQSIDLFRNITTQYPDIHLSYVGYSLALENAGSPKSALKVLKKAQVLVAKSEEDNELKESMKARIKELENPPKPPPVDEKKAKIKIRRSQLKNRIFFIGGNTSSGGTGFTMRIGAHSGRGIEGGLDLGYDPILKGMTVGVSGYAVKKQKNSSFSIIYGLGLRNSPAGANVVLTFGTRRPVARLDNVELNFLVNIEGGSVFKAGLTVGMSSYFGKR